MNWRLLVVLAAILSCEVFDMRRVVALLIGCSLISGFAVADTSDPGLKNPNTVHGVYQACTSAQPFAKGYCAGFVLGAIGEITHSNRLCFSPEGVSADQLIQAFEKWHDAHREAWQEPSSDGARSAFLTTWACSR
jgi:Rap1a immunity proteins